MVIGNRRPAPGRRQGIYRRQPVVLPEKSAAKARLPLPKAARMKRARRRRNPYMKLPAASENPQISVIIPVAEERKTLPSVLRQIAGIAKEIEVILVVNGAEDGTLEFARQSGAKVINFPHRLGHDVGRCIGAKAARGDILLFLDGDFAVSKGALRTFIRACRHGVDIALNSYNGPINLRQTHDVVLAKYVLNDWLNRPDLEGASMTAVPHAITRRALEAIGAEHLAVPPLAQAMAIRKGLKVKSVCHVDVGRKNPVRRRSRRIHELTSLIVGDHLEALHWLLQESGPRLNRTDLQRRRMNTADASALHLRSGSASYSLEEGHHESEWFQGPAAGRSETQGDTAGPSDRK